MRCTLLFILNKMHKYAVIVSCIALIVLVSCEPGLDGELNENLPPTTSLTVNEINLPEGERLVSQVDISWWGDDPDGYVVGYELFIGDVTTANNEDWTFTTSSDSTFILPINEGEQNADVQFTVRAVDNDDARDPDPQSVVFPITNSVPEIEFNNFETPPDTTYRIASFGFNAFDPDGDANLNRIEIALNDTTSDDAWKDIGLGFDLVTLRIDDTKSTPTAEVLLGRSASSSEISFDEINLNSENEFFIRSIDNAASVSDPVAYNWHVKKQESTVLFLNDYQGDDSEDRFTLHRELLSQAGITEIDYLDISDGTPTGGRRVQLSQAFPDRSLSSPTINMMLAEWDHIYWISDNLDRNIGYALEITLDFFEQGGTMFVNIPSKFISDDNSLLQFLPFERVEPVPSGEQSFYIRENSELRASGDMENAPQLTFRRNRTAEHPIVPFGETVPLFEAPFLVRGGFPATIKDFDGSKLISATNPEENLIYFGVDFNEFPTPNNSDCLPEEEIDENDEDAPEPCSEIERLVELLVIDILEFQQ